MKEDYSEPQCFRVELFPVEPVLVNASPEPMKVENDGWD